MLLNDTAVNCNSCIHLLVQILVLQKQLSDFEKRYSTFKLMQRLKSITSFMLELFRLEHQFSLSGVI